jgi:hypothetical protein
LALQREVTEARLEIQAADQQSIHAEQEGPWPDKQQPRPGGGDSEGREVPAPKPAKGLRAAAA